MAALQGSRTLFIVGCLVTIVGCGPVYLHDPAGQKASTDAQTEFQAIATRRSSTGFTAGYLRQRAVTDEVDAALDALSQDNQIAALSSSHWTQLRSALCSEMVDTVVESGMADEISAGLNTGVCSDEDLPAIRERLAEAAAQEAPKPPCIVATAAASRLEERQCVEEELRGALAAIPGVQATKASLQESLNAAADAETRYAASQKLLGAGLAAIFNSEPASADRAKALQEVLESTVPTRSFDVDNKGNLVEHQGTVTVGSALFPKGLNVSAFTTQPSSVGDLINLAEAADSLRAFRGLLPANPGIEVTIIGLGYDVARAQELRLGAIIDGAKRRIALYDDQIAFLTQHLDSLDDANASFIVISNISEVRSDGSIRDTLEKIARGGRGRRGDLASVFQATGDYSSVMLVGATKRLNFAASVDALDVEESLTKAEVTLREREAVIGRGLQGLVAFHEGGIDAQDLNNVLQAAQAVGIFAIAAK